METTDVSMYIGDGVYAEFDGFQVWIWVGDGVKDGPRIALEPGTLANLIAFAKQVGGLR